MRRKPYMVVPVAASDTYHWLLHIHYAKRLPSISYAFGLFHRGTMVGVVTYGSPPNKSQRTGIAGPKWGANVLELNRLCLTHNRPHEASRLVGASLKLLPRDTIIISYADRDGQGHAGIVYQATNFIYCGLTAKRTNWRAKGFEHLHSSTFPARFNDFAAQGYARKIDYAKAVHGDDFYYEQRPRKHRYLYLHGSKTFRKQVLRDLIYPIEEYPK